MNFQRMLKLKTITEHNRQQRYVADIHREKAVFYPRDAVWRQYHMTLAANALARVEH